MQQIKQVEVRMDESHLEGRADAPESTCSMVCDKIMKNMVLTLTILGKCSWHWRDAFTFTSYFCLFWSRVQGGEAELLLTELLQGGGQTRSHPRTINLNCMLLGRWKIFPDPLLWRETYKCHHAQMDEHQNVFLDVNVAKIPARKRRRLR